MKLVLHIGKEKTGTTTIQHFMKDNASEMRRSGIFYPEFPWGLNFNHCALAGFVTEDGANCPFYKNNGLVTHQDVASFKVAFKSHFEKIYSLNKNSNRWVLSAEHLSYLPRRSVKFLSEFLAGFFCEIRVIVYLRRQDEHAISRYSELLKGGRLSGEFDFRKLGGYSFFEHEKFLDMWSEFFGSAALAVRPFQSSDLKDGDLLEDFCFNAGIPAGSWERPKPQNESLSKLGQAFLSRANKHIPRFEDNVRSPLRANIVEITQGLTQGENYLPLRSDALEYYSQFRESNDRAAERYLARKSLFNEDFSKYPLEFSKEDVLSVEDAVWLGCEIYKMKQLELNRTKRASVSKWKRFLGMIRHHLGAVRL